MIRDSGRGTETTRGTESPTNIVCTLNVGHNCILITHGLLAAATLNCNYLRSRHRQSLDVPTKKMFHP